MRSVIVAAWAAIRRAFGLEDLVLLIALSLLAIGLWQAWKPGAFIVPGLILLWLSLPARTGFVVKEQQQQKPSRHDAGGSRRS